MTRLILLAGLLMMGCATAQSRPPDIVEALVEAPEDKVRAALITVLTNEGYQVRESDSKIVSRGHRQEIQGPWNSLLRSWFGTSRSRVEAVTAQEGPDATRVTIEVRHEAKDNIWKVWKRSTPPLRQSAINQFRLLRNELGLLEVQFISEDSSPSSSPNLSAIR